MRRVSCELHRELRCTKFLYLLPLTLLHFISQVFRLLLLILPLLISLLLRAHWQQGQKCAHASHGARYYGRSGTSVVRAAEGVMGHDTSGSRRLVACVVCSVERVESFFARNLYHIMKNIYLICGHTCFFVSMLFCGIYYIVWLFPAKEICNIRLPASESFKDTRRGVQVYIYIYIYIYIYTYKIMFTSMHIYIYIYVYMYIHSIHSRQSERTSVRE